MKRHWLYAILGASWAVMFFLGVVVGSRLVRHEPVPAQAVTPPQESPRQPQAQVEPRERALDVLSRPLARQIFDGALSHKNAELTVFRSRNKVTLRAGKLAFDNSKPAELAEAMDELARLVDSGLIRSSRGVQTSGEMTTDTEVYSVTSLGHSVAKEFSSTK